VTIISRVVEISIAGGVVAMVYGSRFGLVLYSVSRSINLIPSPNRDIDGWGRILRPLPSSYVSYHSVILPVKHFALFRSQVPYLIIALFCVLYYKADRV